MTPVETLVALERLRALWPGAMTEEAQTAYAERFERMELAEARLVLDAIADTGVDRRPTPGKIRSTFAEMFPRPPTDPCICWKPGFDPCPARHSAGWRERQKARDEAIGIMDRAGGLVDPAGYPAHLRDPLETLLVRQSLDQSYARIAEIREAATAARALTPAPPAQ